MTSARVCQHCGMGIEGKRKDAKWCGGVCRGKATLEAGRIRCRRHYEKHTIAMKARSKKWKQENPEAVRQQKARAYRKNPEKAKAQMAAWKQANPERSAQARAAWEHKNRDSLDAYARCYVRTRAAAQHMQHTIAAIQEIMALIAEMENSNDQ